MSDGIIYNLEGRILRTLSMSMEMLVIQANEGETLLLDSVATEHTHYVVNGEVLERPPSNVVVSKTTIIADGVDSIIFSNVPNGHFLAIDKRTRVTGAVGPIEGTDSFSTTIIGNYKIILYLFPYLDFETTIEAI